MLVDDFRKEKSIEISSGKINYSTLLKYKKLGMNKDTMLSVLDSFRAEMREKDDEITEDMIMDYMDCVVGYCNPQWNLYPD